MALLNDNFVRIQGHLWKAAKKNQIGASGMWKCDPTRLKLSWNKLNDGTRAVMKDCYGPSKFEYFENAHELEKKVFGEHNLEKDFDILLLDKYNEIQHPNHPSVISQDSEESKRRSSILMKGGA